MFDLIFLFTWGCSVHCFIKKKSFLRTALSHSSSFVSVGQFLTSDDALCDFGHYVCQQHNHKGGVLGAVCALCARCAKSLYRTMPNLHSSA